MQLRSSKTHEIEQDSQENGGIVINSIENGLGGSERNNYRKYDMEEFLLK